VGSCSTNASAGDAEDAAPLPSARSGEMDTRAVANGGSSCCDSCNAVYVDSTGANCDVVDGSSFCVNCDAVAPGLFCAGDAGLNAAE